MAAGPDADAIVAAYVQDRWSVGQCALAFGLTRAQVRWVLDRRGVVRDPRRRMLRVTIDQDALAAAYRRGLSLQATARTFHVDRRTAARVLDRHQVSRHPAPRRRARDLDEAAIVRAYRDEGQRLAAVARAAGVSPAVARRVLAGHDVPLRPRTGVADTAVLAARTRDGLTVAETAVKFGINPTTVRRIMARHPAAPDPADLIPAGPAAAILGIPRARLEASARAWGIEVHRTPGGHRRYRRGQITDAATRHRPGAADRAPPP